MPGIPTVLSFLWKYRAAFIALLTVAALYLYSYHSGEGHIQAQWDAQTVKQERQAQAMREAIIAAANQKSALLEAELAAMKDTQLKLRRKLDAEITRNRAYRDCVVPADGLSILNQTIAGSSISAR